MFYSYFAAFRLKVDIHTNSIKAEFVKPPIFYCSRMPVDKKTRQGSDSSFFLPGNCVKRREG